MKSIYFLMKISICLVLFLLASFTVKSQAQEVLSREYFTENKGQWSSSVGFANFTTEQNTWITKNSIVFDYSKFERASDSFFNANRIVIPEPGSRYENMRRMRIRGHVLSMDFEGANPNAEKSAENNSDFYYNYVSGSGASNTIGTNSNNVVSRVSSYKKAGFESIYPGIDEIFYYKDGKLKYEFHLAAGSNPSDIRFHFTGADACSVGKDGNLNITISSWQVTHGDVVAYQEIDGKIEQISCNFEQVGKNSFGFRLGEYNSNYPLVIDPIIYSTYLGGSLNEWASIYKPTGLDADTSGCAYITGCTLSSNFPTTSGCYDALYNGDSLIIANPETGLSYYWKTGDIFVTKLNKEGSGLVFSTFVGGRSNEIGNDIVVDSIGEVFVTGMSCSSNFPTSPTAFCRTFSRGGVWYNDVVTFKLSSDGTNLLYSTFLGGIDDDQGLGICIDNAGCAYITGFSESGAYPVTTNAYQSNLFGTCDGFITKINPTGSALLFSSYIGGYSRDESHSIATDSNNTVYITGYTDSDTYPTTANAYRRTAITLMHKDVFVTVLSLPSGTGSASLLYSTYLGSTGNESGEKIRRDRIGSLYVGGWTSSTTGYPVTLNCFQNTYHGGATDGFLTVINPSLTGVNSLIYSTYFGGNGADTIQSISVDPIGITILTGTTNSTNFPVSANVTQQTLQGGYDAFISKISPYGNSTTDLLYSTYLGGSNDDAGSAIVMYKSDYAFVSGFTNSTNFPSTTGSFRSVNSGGYDIFLLKAFISSSVYLSFTAPDTVCVGQPVSIVNFTEGSSAYYWNFCAPDIELQPTVTNLGNFGYSNASFASVPDLKNDNGNFYMFSMLGSKILKFSFGTSLSTTPTVSEINVLSGITQGTPQFKCIRVVKDNNNWYGFISVFALYPSQQLICVVNFGNSLSNTPTLVNTIKMKDILSSSYNISSINIIKDGANWILLGIDAYSVCRFNFGSNILNPSPMGEKIPFPFSVVSYLNGCDLVKKGDSWYFFAMGQKVDGNSYLHRLIFPQSLLNDPLIDSIYIDKNKSKFDIKAYKYCDNDYLFTNVYLQMSSVPYKPDSTLQCLDFSNDYSSLPSLRSYKYNGSELIYNQALTNFYRSGDSIVFFGLGVTGMLYPNTPRLVRFAFTSPQKANVTYSKDQQPPEFHYTEPGIYRITLTVNEGKTDEAMLCKDIIVLGKPNTDITGSRNVCSGSTVQYSYQDIIGLTSKWYVTGGTLLTADNINNISVKWLAPGTGKVKLVRANTLGCSDSTEIIVTINALPDAHISGPVSKCVNSTDKYYATVHDLSACAWQVQGGAITNRISNDTIIVTWTTIGKGTIILTKTDPTIGCINTDSLKIDVNQLPSIDLGSDITVCTGATVQIGTAATNGKPPYTYLWQSSAGTFDNIHAVRPIVTPSTSGKYYVTATDANGCIAVDSMSVIVNSTIQLDLGADTLICFGTPASIGRVPTGGVLPYSFHWAPNVNLSTAIENFTVASPIATTKYFLTVTDAVGCTIIDSIIVIVNPKIIVNQRPVVTVCADSSVVLDPDITSSNDFTIKWDPATGLDDITKVRPTMTLSTSGDFKYTFIVTDKYNCTSSGEQKVHVRYAPALSITTSEFDFGFLGECSASKDSAVLVKNSGYEDITVDEIQAEGPFAVISQPLPFTIIAGDTRGIMLKFSPTSAGSFNGKVTFKCSPCNYTFEINLKGEKLTMLVSTSVPKIDFQSQPYCGTEIVLDSSFRVNNNGTESVLLKFSGAPLFTPYELVSPLNDVTLLAGKSQEVVVRFKGSYAGVYNRTVSIPYEAGACKDTLKVSLTEVLANIEATCNVTKIDFPVMMGCDAKFDTVVTVTNSGTDTLHVESISPASLFSTITPLPLDIPMGESKDIKLTFAPDKQGDFSGQISFIYTPCNKSFSIDYTARKEAIEFISLDTIHFPTLKGCDNSYDTTITITNSGLSKISLSSITPSDVFSVKSDLPVEIEGGTSGQVTFTITPKGIGLFTADAGFYFTPCNSTEIVTCTINKETINFFAPDTVDLGEIVSCKDTARAKFKIINQSMGDFEGTVTEVIQPSKNFLCNAKSGDVIKSKGSIEYEVTFTTDVSEPTGMYYGTLKLKVLPCDTILTINFKIRKYVFELSAVGYKTGIVRSGESDTGYAYIINKSNIKASIDSIGGIMSPFELLSTQPALPAILNAGDSLKVKVRYTCLIEGLNSQDFQAFSVEPCSTSISCTNSGDCLPPQDYKAVVEINSDSIKAGEKINLPLMLIYSENLNNTDFTGFEAEIAYNSTMLEPVEFTPLGNDRIKSFIVNKPWDINNSSGVLSDIWFFAALGDAECTDLLIKSFKWTGSLPCIIETRDGIFCLKGICKDGGTRLIDPNGKVEVKAIKPNPFDENAEIELSVLENGITKLRLMNVLGESILTLCDGELSAGTHFIKLDGSSLSSGSYLLVLETPTISKTYKLEVIR